MTSQYDSIGARYNTIKQLPVAVVERENVKAAVLPYLRRKSKTRVLDLACGTGFYSQILLSWGAGYVHGVDLSAQMIEVAKQTMSEEQRQKRLLRFSVGDAGSLGEMEGEGPFDLIIGSWLLNYAANLDEMTQMFRTIKDNLGPRGVFVGVTPHPLEDVDAYARTLNDHFEDHMATWKVAVKYFERLESGEGWRAEVVVQGETPVSFTNFHLRKSIYEEAARRSGLEGKLSWKEVEVPPEAYKMTETSPRYWDDYNRFCFGIFIVEK
jgi:SAM-dependent methyltransferase